MPDANTRHRELSREQPGFMTRLARWIGFLTMTAALGGTFALFAGFCVFAWRIATDEPKNVRKADGIVVLTGAAARIPDGLELLASKHGQRLLITGVHRATSAREIARLMPLYQGLFTCCVDLDRSALNTFGNAIEAKRWAREKNFSSLIVVTSNWHMPRALVELGYQLPDVTLIPFPVVSEKVKSEPWWSNAGTARLLFAEYLKYLLALVRLHIDPESAA
jgi:uncharacterized SAM-binding protein YcdF (DUF218 family)